MVERIREILESRQLTPTQFADLIGVARPIVSHILSGRNKPSLEVVQRILAAMPDLAMPWLLNGAGPMLAPAAAMPAMSPEAASGAAAPTTPSPVSVVDDERAQAPVLATVEAPQAPELSAQMVGSKLLNTAALPVAPLRASIPAPARSRVVTKRFIASAAPLDALPTDSDTSQAPPPPPTLEAELPPTMMPMPEAITGPSASLPTHVVEVPATAAPFQPLPAPATPGDALASALFAGGDKPIRRIVIFYRDGSFADYQPE
jgi:transcriptional regulator with XRE-family HTH domain